MRFHHPRSPGKRPISISHTLPPSSLPPAYLLERLSPPLLHGYTHGVLRRLDLGWMITWQFAVWCVAPAVLNCRLRESFLTRIQVCLVGLTISACLCNIDPTETTHDPLTYGRSRSLGSRATSYRRRAEAGKSHKTWQGKTVEERMTMVEEKGRRSDSSATAGIKY